MGLRVNVSQGASSLETLANDGKYEPSSEILNYKIISKAICPGPYGDLSWHMLSYFYGL